MIKQLTKLATHLDRKGHRKEADFLDSIITKIANEQSEQLQGVMTALEGSIGAMGEEPDPNQFEAHVGHGKVDASWMLDLPLKHIIEFHKNGVGSGIPLMGNAFASSPEMKSYMEYTLNTFMSCVDQHLTFGPPNLGAEGTDPDIDFDEVAE